MASGHLNLDLTERLNWEEFPLFADKFIKFFNGSLLSKFDGPDVRIWDIVINNQKYRLTFDDYPVMVSLESMDEAADNEISKILEALIIKTK